MSPSPLFLLQNNSNLPRNQNISLSNLDSEQDFPFNNNKEEELTASFPCSSSSSSNSLVKTEELRVVIEPPDGADDDEDQNGGYRTPSSLESRIPAVVHCPPAPKKKPYKACRRKAIRHCSKSQRIDFLEGLGLVVFEEVSCRCHRRRRRHRLRERLPITNASHEAGKRELGFTGF